MLIIGAKGFAKELLEIFHQNNQTSNLSFYDDVNDVKNYLIENENQIQCVVGNDMQDNPNYVEFGQTQFPKLTDYADNIDTLKFLAKL